jgi:hypothetical protein
MMSISCCPDVLFMVLLSRYFSMSDFRFSLRIEASTLALTLK